MLNGYTGDPSLTDPDLTRSIPEATFRKRAGLLSLEVRKGPNDDFQPIWQVIVTLDDIGWIVLHDCEAIYQSAEAAVRLTAAEPEGICFRFTIGEEQQPLDDIGLVLLDLPLWREAYAEKSHKYERPPRTIPKELLVAMARVCDLTKATGEAARELKAAEKTLRELELAAGVRPLEF